MKYFAPYSCFPSIRPDTSSPPASLNMDPFTPEREPPPAYTPGLSRPFPVHTEHNSYIVDQPFDTVFLIEDSGSMVHIALIWWLEGHDERASWTGTAAARVEELVPYGGHERKEVLSVHLPHGMYVAGLVEIIDGTTSASFLERLGRCEESAGRYAPAEASHRKVSSLRTVVLGREHPDTLTSTSNLAVVLGSQGKYEEAEAMNRQTLARREKVLGLEHPDTLMSVYCLAYLLAKQYRVDESLILYRRASSGYNTTLREDHPTTKACDQHYAELCALQEQNQLSGPPSTLDSGTGTYTSKRLRLSRWLAKIDIRSSKH
jgi:tetratricopeptide (TPR) repeat protein